MILRDALCCPLLQADHVVAPVGSPCSSDLREAFALKHQIPRLRALRHPAGLAPPVLPVHRGETERVLGPRPATVAPKYERRQWFHNAPHRLGNSKVVGRPHDKRLRLRTPGIRSCRVGARRRAVHRAGPRLGSPAHAASSGRCSARRGPLQAARGCEGASRRTFSDHHFRRGALVGRARLLRTELRTRPGGNPVSSRLDGLSQRRKSFRERTVTVRGRMLVDGDRGQRGVPGPTRELGRRRAGLSRHRERRMP